MKQKSSLSVNQIERKNLDINNIAIVLLLAHHFHVRLGLATSEIWYLF